MIETTCWVISSVMMFFEYRRALGHVWYVHGLFWWLSAFICFADLTLFYTIEQDVTHEAADTNITIVLLIGGSLAILLGVLKIIYPDDLPVMRRTYIRNRTSA